MADSAVGILLQNVSQLLLYHTHLITDAKVQIEKLEKDLRLFKAFLKDSTKKRRKDDSLKEVIRDVVYEAEDVIDVFVTEVAVVNKFKKAFKTPPVSLHKIARDVEAVSRKVQEIYGGGQNKMDFSNLNITDSLPEENEEPQVRQDNVVGFEDVTDELLGYLLEETEQRDVISIIGMPGLGKTTVAEKVFHDPRTQYEFPIRLWVYISQDFTRKSVFLAILNQLPKLGGEIYDQSDQELARIVEARLQVGRILIVMDDVWSTEDWDKLDIALPKSNNVKIIITSRDVSVARHANRKRNPYKLRFMTHAESWMLLKREVFREVDCPEELEVLGRLIVEQCDRLHLAVVVIAGILVKKFSATEDLAVKRNAWTKVLECVKTFRDTEDPMKRMESIVAMSYANLPYHLRACFLYFGVFPEGYEIPVWKLTRLWIAEGFIQQRAGMSLEEDAEYHLAELINRNLVRVEKVKKNGKVKTCRIHDVLRDFCKREAGVEKENFFQEMKTTCEGIFDPPLVDLQKHRRISIHSDVLSFASSKPFGPRVRSFLCLSRDEFNLPKDCLSAIPAAFKLLRVLESKALNFTKIPSDFYHLVHLRYINISCNLATLPPAFAKLWNLQTIVIDTPSRTLEIQADIWKLLQLRHLKTNAVATLPATLTKTDKNTKEGESIQTFTMISPESCTDEVFDRFKNVKKLGIRGELALFFGVKNKSFGTLDRLTNLEMLKLLNDFFPSPCSDGKLHSLPPVYHFPPKLRSLTLSETFLDWDQMSILGLLEKLEILKLKDKAFVGKHWKVSDGGFRHLEVLQIGRTDLVVWIVSGNQFPRLTRLELKNCEHLQEVPIVLAEIPAFQVLDLYRTKDAAQSAKKILEEKRKIEQEKSLISRFKLTVFPPE